MLILSVQEEEVPAIASLSRRKDANSQRQPVKPFTSRKSIKKEGC